MRPSMHRNGIDLMPFSLKRLLMHFFWLFIDMMAARNPRFLRSIFQQLRLRIEKADGVWLTTHTRPQLSHSIGTWSDRLINRPKFAIVIQGPVVKDFDFTLETVRTYKKTFTNPAIILSTWNGENTEYLELFKGEGIEILLNEYPENRGIENINYQIVSSFAGVKRAKELGSEYVLKTRTDQRIYATNVDEYLYSVAKAFPVVSCYKQKQRIVGVSMNTFKYRLYGLSDMTIFGQIDDMMLFWDARLDEREQVQIGQLSVKQWAYMRFCEVYLVTEFLLRIGRKIRWSLEDSWKVFADHFCVVDKSNLDIYWIKYDRQKEHRWLDYSSIKNSQELTFHEWFSLYSNLQNKIIPDDRILDNPFSTPITRYYKTFEN